MNISLDLPFKVCLLLPVSICVPTISLVGDSNMNILLPRDYVAQWTPITSNYKENIAGSGPPGPIFIL